LPDGVEVKECLGRVLSGAIPCVDNRNRGEFRGEPGRTFFRVADDNRICIPAYHPDRIGKGLALCHRACLDAAHRDGGPAETCHRGFKGHSCAGTGFEKENGKDFAVEGIFIVFSLAYLLRMIQQPVDCAAVKIPDGNNVMRGNSSRTVVLK
jgi:hypothetical protein